jgi:phosphoribosyl 1,2-cyclic phosphate phosphodiesterase
MRFTFLGTGTSSGIPAIGCECAVCTSTDPKDNRLRTAAAIEFKDAKGQDRTILLDAGPDLRQQALRAKLTRCDAILFTHNHVDHVFGLDEVRRFNVLQKSPIDIYAEPHTMEHLERVYRHIFERHKNVNDSFVATLIAHRIDESTVKNGTAIDLYGAKITPIRFLHGRLPILGFRIDFPGLGDSDVFPLAYCTDVSAIPPESWGRLTGLKTLVLDALRHRHHPTHFTVQEAANAAEEIGAKRTYFIHMTHDLGHAETQAGLPEGMSLAWDGLVLGG